MMPRTHSMRFATSPSRIERRIGIPPATLASNPVNKANPRTAPNRTQITRANPVSDEELKKIYQEQAPSGDEYKARHILVKEEDEAKTLIVELDNGADFSELAKQHSTGPSGKSGGELGWFSPKQMVAPFSEAVAGMEKGAYTKQPIKTQFGWHIIILDDTREASPPPFEQLKPQLQAFVQKQRVQAYITRLRESATIEIKEQPPAAAADQAEPADAASGEDKP